MFIIFYSNENIFLFLGNIKTKAVLDVESKRGYWLTVYAQDHGVVPLSSSLQVCIKKINYIYNVLYYSEKYYAFRKFC